MAWQDYVDSNLVGTGNIQQAAICGYDGNPWAISPGFKVTSTEVKNVLAGFTDPSNLRSQGMFIAGEKYLVVAADDRSINGKKGLGGVVAVKTGQTVLIGVYGSKTQLGQALNTVEKLADYLIENGY